VAEIAEARVGAPAYGRRMGRTSLANTNAIDEGPRRSYS